MTVDTALRGYTTPRTPLGKAGLVPPPPWHYVGDFLVVDYHADPEVAASLLPEGLDPHPDAPMWRDDAPGNREGARSESTKCQISAPRSLCQQR